MEHYSRYEQPQLLPIQGKKDFTDNNVYVFDTEVSSLFKINGKWQGFDYNLSGQDYTTIEKSGVLYLWGFSANDKCYYGRTLKEFKELLEYISDKNLKKIIYVHNLGYDFQFLLNIIDDFEVFARKPRHPIKAYSPSLNIEFRCSYILTNSSLDNLAKDYKLPVKKLVGALDYDKPRHSGTPITDREKEYLEHDLLCVYYFIKNVMLPEYKTITKIPLTQTGRVRREVKRLFAGNKKYYLKMKKLQPQTVHEFQMLRQAFAGGWTHANLFYSDKILDNVYSFDRASSYPSVMIMEKFPMSEFVDSIMPIDHIDFNNNACLIDITFYDLQSITFNTYLSISKSIDFDRCNTDNGRVMYARMIRYVITDVDYQIIKRCYKWDKCEVNELKVAQKSYLPKKYIDYICKLYKDKTELKGIDDKKELYQRIKEFINSLYGMTVTNTIQDETTLADKEWITTKLTLEDIQKKLDEQNKKSNFLSYAWGVWVTAYARYELWKIILEMDESVVYCDTDSIKFVNDNNFEVFEEYNKNYLERLHNRGINYDFLAPYDKFGKRHPIGVFEQEATADKFKTLGAKKYCCQYGDKLKITVSGVPKKKGAEQLSSIEEFQDGFIFGYEADKLLSYYNTAQCITEPIVFTDYLGNVGSCNDNYGVCLMPTTYELGLEMTYAQMIDIIDSQPSNKPSALEKGLPSEFFLKLLKVFK